MTEGAVDRLRPAFPAPTASTAASSGSATAASFMERLASHHYLLLGRPPRAGPGLPGPGLRIDGRRHVLRPRPGIEHENRHRQLLLPSLLRRDLSRPDRTPACAGRSTTSSAGRGRVGRGRRLAGILLFREPGARLPLRVGGRAGREGPVAGAGLGPSRRPRGRPQRDCLAADERPDPQGRVHGRRDHADRGLLADVSPRAARPADRRHRARCSRKA